jgi:hypothetical protein
MPEDKKQLQVLLIHPEHSGLGVEMYGVLREQPFKVTGFNQFAGTPEMGLPGL